MDSNDIEKTFLNGFKAITIILLLLTTIALAFCYYDAKKELYEYKNLFYQIDTLNNEMQSKIDSMDRVDTVYIETIKTIQKIKYVQDNIIYNCNNTDSIYQLFAAYTADTAYWQRYFPGGF